MTIQDPVFGTLEHNGSSWTAQVFVPMLDTHLPLEISAAKEFPPDEEEYVIWQEFMRDQTGLKGVVEKVIFDYYCRHLDNLRMRYNREKAEERAPTLQEPSQIWSLLKPSYVYIELGHDDEACTLTIVFWAQWDEEHGLDVVFYQDQIGVADAGAHWLNHDRYDLQGKLLYLDGEE
jgi:hypothetical protein